MYMLTVNQHWDPLKVCAVGRSYPPEFYDGIKNPRVRSAMKRIATETEEDFQNLISKLKEFDVTVLRTDVSDNIEDYCHNTTFPVKPPPMCPRDFTAMVGNKFYMPGKLYGDNFDVNIMVESILTQLCTNRTIDPLSCELAKEIEDILDPGNTLSPRVALIKLRSRCNPKEATFKVNGTTLNFSKLKGIVDFGPLKEKIIAAQTQTIGSNIKFPNNKNFYSFTTIRDWLEEHNVPIIYDQYINSASMARIGKDLYFGTLNLIDGFSSQFFQEKFENLFPDYRVHVITVGGHSDGSYCPVVPGLIITIQKPRSFKETFPGWEIVSVEKDSWKTNMKGWFDIKIKNAGKWWIPGEENNDDLTNFVEEWLSDWVTYVEETVFDVNMLVIDKNNVICSSYNKDVFDAFERYNITPHIVNFRHRYFWDGGLHCITSDIVREGEQIDYFPERG